MEFGRSEVLFKPCLLQDSICRVTRLDLAVNHEASLGDRAEPDLVIALTVALESATMGEE
jgi:hypothetical protein